ncbi:ABC transporter ATP-binding protein [Cryobacterium sp. TMT1-3]|uniref:ABC transporter ATP-binding protein n=1 Tax=Cryobacterium sp. TMT1-3 TaxID=1259237 RepID=UPI00106B1314|nr:ABC transporter ATP-binding protein [Cryobacterium sp. TMT1-3]TFC28591.1 ABC transporter ATP-binding protein [Cryobacterium sp. TMT1-3]
MTDSTGAALTISRIHKNFGDFAAVKNISIDVRPGEFITFLGPSGSGKTTSLNMIAGFESPSSGDILLDGTSLVNLPIHKRNIGMVFQGYALFPHMTVAENIAYPLKQRKVKKSERARLVSDVLNRVNLSAFSKRLPSDLSGGQRQRVALARAIVYQPPLLLMDEPLSALDKGLRERLQDEIRSIHRDLGTTVVYVTHDQDEALALSDRIVVFNEGRIEQIGTPAELYRAPENLFVAKFLGESLLLHGVITGHRGTTFQANGLDIPVNNPRGILGSASLMIRPEKVTMMRGVVDRPVGVSIAARVELSTYLGHGSRHIVSVGDAGGGVVRIQDDGAATDAAGEQVTLAWAIDDAVLLPSSESTIVGPATGLIDLPTTTREIAFLP